MIKNVKIISLIFYLSSSLFCSYFSLELNSWDSNRTFYSIVRYFASLGAIRKDLFNPNQSRSLTTDFPFIIYTHRIPVQYTSTSFEYYTNPKKELRFLKNIILYPSSKKEYTFINDEVFVINYTQSNKIFIYNALHNLQELKKKCIWKDSFVILFIESEFSLMDFQLKYHISDKNVVFLDSFNSIHTNEFLCLGTKKPL